MTWTKISDDFTDDTWSLSDQAYRLHTEGLIWSNRKLLDLKLPKDDVRRFAKHPDAVHELVEGGWWEDIGDSYIVRHHARYQRSREAVIKQQTVNKQNRARRGQNDKPTREIAPNDSLNDSSHGMDRTGQDRPGRREVPTIKPTTEWPVVPIHRGPVCDVCLMPMPKDSVLTICETNDDAHEEARMRTAS